jgi:hypothetical protein
LLTKIEPATTRTAGLSDRKLMHTEFLNYATVRFVAVAIILLFGDMERASDPSPALKGVSRGKKDNSNLSRDTPARVIRQNL